MALQAQSILVTGASRGIGLEFIRQLVKSGPKVIIAGCRNPNAATELQDIAKQNDKVKILKLDVENDDDIDTAVKETKSLVGDAGLNLLINNAGIYFEKSDGGGVRVQRRDTLQQHFNVNSTSPIIVTQKFLPLLEQAASNDKESPFSCSKAASVIISSIMASQTLTHKDGLGTSLHYKCSKVAATMSGVMMARDLKDSGILVFSIHPGWVKTDMGGPDGSLEKGESVEGILRVLGGAGEKDMGLLVNYKGETVPF